MEAAHLIEDGNIVGLPALTSANVCRAYDIYGVPPGYVRGRLTQRPISWAVVNDSLVMKLKSQCLYSDLMHMDANRF